MELFPFLDKLFTGTKTEWKSIPDSIKEKYGFMTQRFMSIQFPTVAQGLNIWGMSGRNKTELWRIAASRFGGKKPVWLYTKTNKAKVKASKPPIEDRELWCSVWGLSPKDFDSAFALNPQQLLTDIKKLKEVTGASRS